MLVELFSLEVNNPRMDASKMDTMHIILRTYVYVCDITSQSWQEKSIAAVGSAKCLCFDALKYLRNRLSIPIDDPEDIEIFFQTILFIAKPSEHDLFRDEFIAQHSIQILVESLDPISNRLKDPQAI